MGASMYWQRCGATSMGTSAPKTVMHQVAVKHNTSGGQAILHDLQQNSNSPHLATAGLSRRLNLPADESVYWQQLLFCHVNGVARCAHQ